MYIWGKSVASRPNLFRCGSFFNENLGRLIDCMPLRETTDYDKATRVLSRRVEVGEAHATPRLWVRIEEVLMIPVHDRVGNK